LNTAGVHSARSRLKGDALTVLLTEAVAGWTRYLKNMVSIFNQSEKASQKSGMKAIYLVA
jgi:hypothetical protein